MIFKCENGGCFRPLPKTGLLQCKSCNSLLWVFCSFALWPIFISGHGIFFCFGKIMWACLNLKWPSSELYSVEQSLRNRTGSRRCIWQFFATWRSQSQNKNLVKILVPDALLFYYYYFFHYPHLHGPQCMWKLRIMEIIVMEHVYDDWSGLHLSCKILRSSWLVRDLVSKIQVQDYRSWEQQETECLRKKSDIRERAMDFSCKKKPWERERERYLKRK